LPICIGLSVWRIATKTLDPNMLQFAVRTFRFRLTFKIIQTRQAKISIVLKMKKKQT